MLHYLRQIDSAVKNKRHFEIVGSLIEGKKMAEIARKLGVSRQRISQIAYLYGLAPKKRKEMTLVWWEICQTKKFSI